MAFKHAFISYDHRDRATAQAVERGLKNKSLEAFRDEEDIPAGDNWVERLRRNLENVSSVIVLWSKASVDSLWVRSEAAEAAHCGKLISVRIQNVCVPSLFDRFQAIDLLGWSHNTRAKKFKKVIEAVKYRAKVRDNAAATPGWFEKLPSTKPVRDLNLALEHTTWLDPTKGNDVYQLRVILVGHPTALARVKHVRYYLEGWDVGETHLSRNAGRNFELKQIVYSVFVVRATVRFKTRQKDMRLSRLVRPTDTGPFLEPFMLDPNA